MAENSTARVCPSSPQWQVHDPSYMIGRGKSERWMEEMKEIPEIHLTATEVEEE